MAAAAKTLPWTPDIRGARDWSWTLLRGLRVVQTFLDDGAPDAVALTSRLAKFVEGGVEQADTYRKELNALAAEYTSVAADVIEAAYVGGSSAMSGSPPRRAWLRRVRFSLSVSGSGIFRHRGGCAAVAATSRSSAVHSTHRASPCCSVCCCVIRRRGGASTAMLRLGHLVSGASGTVPTVQSPQPLPVQHWDGSYYPAAAAWALDVLPRRVREGEERERTVGQVMLAGTSVGQMISGRDGTWTSDIQRRLRELRVRVRIRLENHVEMKVAQMMIHTGSQNGEVVINHVPCGALPRQAIGCHQVLERYLPNGYTLTVHGTTQQGRPFSWTYRGQV